MNHYKVTIDPNMNPQVHRVDADNPARAAEKAVIECDGSCAWGDYTCLVDDGENQCHVVVNVAIKTSVPVYLERAAVAP